MPEKSFTVATYAAGASLAAITLIYVFAPTYFLDSEPSGSSSGGLLSGGSRKKGVVGLVNPANDCFINSVLQALAGLGDLRLYLIREMHRRNIDDAWVYSQPVPEDFSDRSGNPDSKRLPAWKVEGQQMGLVTQGLKDILDQLNERPIYKKTITAAPFVRVLETAFRQRISRQQQDAQEFLQVVAERLCEEYHAGRRARRYARWITGQESSHGPANGVDSDAVEQRLARLALQEQSRAEPAIELQGSVLTAHPTNEDGVADNDADVDEEGFPMEGMVESQIECLTCGFKPRPTESSFCTLTLHVPQVSSTTLSQCFDEMFKTEYIDDFKCEKCRLVAAQQRLEEEIQRSPSQDFKARAQEDLDKLQTAIDTDPEGSIHGVDLPDSKYAPRRKIARHTRVTDFPKVLAIHLSRSIYDAGQTSMKNSAKVAFPERLPLGGLLQQKKYKLLGLVTHKGSHHSGHYESFRRQNTYPPYSNPSTFQPSGIYSKSATPISTPKIGAAAGCPRGGSPLTSTPDLLSTASASRPSLESGLLANSSRRSTPPLTGNSLASSRQGPTSAPRDAAKDRDTDSSSLKSVAASARSTLSRMSPSKNGSGTGSRTGTPVPDGTPDTKSAAAVGGKTTKRKRHDRWWRISDEKIKEASTREVLGMQREVYLLFYELERDGM